MKEVIHFMYSVGDISDNKNQRIACMPHLREFHTTKDHHAYKRTDDARAVTCLECMKLPIYKDWDKQILGRVRG